MTLSVSLLVLRRRDVSYNGSGSRSCMHLPYQLSRAYILAECIMTGRYKPYRHRLQIICTRSRQAANEVPAPAPYLH